MEASFEQFVSDVGKGHPPRKTRQRRAYYGGNLNGELSTMASRVSPGQASGAEDELARISRQGYSFSNRQPDQPEEEDILDDFGQ